MFTAGYELQRALILIEPHRSPIRPINNIRFNHMIPLQLNGPANTRLNNQHTYNIPMMTGYYPRENFPRTPYPNRPKRPPLRDDSFHYF
ncbi:Putative protein OK/SW-CL.16 [Bos mutus]|uniref:Uncharacterized protein n=1 Tax=Bos mutus TaxID=72004 RepID=L8HSG1_9CETA|nr:Putative protein OK/SW-CL.16 [Bos mutus]